jgi:hypothetical protein
MLHALSNFILFDFIILIILKRALITKLLIVLFSNLRSLHTSSVQIFYLTLSFETHPDRVLPLIPEIKFRAHTESQAIL